MEIDRMIEIMQKLRQDHGPRLQVMTKTSVGLRKSGRPVVRFRNKRQPMRRLFIEGADPDQDRGDKVVLLD